MFALFKTIPPVELPEYMKPIHCICVPQSALDYVPSKRISKLAKPKRNFGFRSVRKPVERIIFPRPVVLQPNVSSRLRALAEPRKVYTEETRRYFSNKACCTESRLMSAGMVRKLSNTSIKNSFKSNNTLHFKNIRIFSRS